MPNSIAVLLVAALMSVSNPAQLCAARLSPSKVNPQKQLLELTKKKKDKRKVFLTIGATCPKAPGEGTLDLIEKNRDGEIFALSFTFKDNEIQGLDIQYAAANSGFTSSKVNPDEIKSKKKRMLFGMIVDKAEAINTSVCLADAKARSAYFEQLKQHNVTLNTMDDQDAKSKSKSRR